MKTHHSGRKGPWGAGGFGGGCSVGGAKWGSVTTLEQERAQTLPEKRGIPMIPSSREKRGRRLQNLVRGEGAVRLQALCTTADQGGKRKRTHTVSDLRPQRRGKERRVSRFHVVTKDRPE